MENVVISKQAQQVNFIKEAIPCKFEVGDIVRTIPDYEKAVTSKPIKKGKIEVIERGLESFSGKDGEEAIFEHKFLRIKVGDMENDSSTYLSEDWLEKV